MIQPFVRADDPTIYQSFLSLEIHQIPCARPLFPGANIMASGMRHLDSAICGAVAAEFRGS